MEENKMDLSFSGAGFMGCYYFGVVDCWNKYIPRERVNRVAGASAGSLIAAYYLCELPLGKCLKEIIALTEDIRRRPLGVFDRSNQIVDVLPRTLERLFPDDAHKRVSGKLHVCLTRLKDMKKIIVNEFESKKDLIDALNCSCFIPVWSGNHVSTYKGVKHIDGGFSDNLPVFDEHTIRICCFSGASDISPYDRAKLELLSAKILNTPLYLNFANCRRMRKALFPPPASFIVDLLERGFHDTKDFILSNDLIQCDPCYSKTSRQDQLVYRRCSPMITPSASPAISRAGSFRQLAADDDHRYVVAGGELNLGQARTRPSESPSSSDRRKKEDRKKGKKERSFDVLVSEKLLRTCAPADLKVDDNNNNTCSVGGYFKGNTPTIMINDTSAFDPSTGGQSSSDNEDAVSSSSAESDGSDGMQHSNSVCRITRNGAMSANKKRAVPKVQQVPGARGGQRRSSALFHQSADECSAGAEEPSKLLVMQDRFTLAPSPLPSCPPSPNLNRHCTECIRLRQEARMDAVEKQIRRVAEQFLSDQPQPMRVGGFKDKLASPLRWLRSLGSRSSYKFHPNTANTTDRRPREASLRN